VPLLTSGAMSPLPSTPSWHAHLHIYPYLRVMCDEVYKLLQLHADSMSCYVYGFAIDNVVKVMCQSHY